MRILLQNRETNRYLAPDGQWSDSADAALEFVDFVQARNYGSLHGPATLRVVALAGRSGNGAPALVSRQPRHRFPNGAL